MFEKLIRELKGQCVRCGKTKIDHRGADACPDHDLYRTVRIDGELKLVNRVGEIYKSETNK